ncbi:MAG: hypothetical protein HY002_21445 [Candidatus Rokubacteria bacterium]|nr:hypothetical protein [Candidatus Rokubacteria bacterium]
MSLGTPARVLAVAAGALIVATGLCLFDAEATGPDLCLSFLAPTIGLFLTILLALTGYSVRALASAYERPALDPRVPPPKS